MTFKQLTIPAADWKRHCSGCGIPLTDEISTADNSKRDKRFHRCVACNSKFNADYYQRNVARIKAKSNARRAAKMRRLQDFTAQQWLELCQRYGNGCLACGEIRPLTADHIVPISQGGSNEISNIQPLCLDCNLRKRVKVIDYRPKEPEVQTVKTIVIEIKIS